MAGVRPAAEGMAGWGVLAACAALLMTGCAAKPGRPAGFIQPTGMVDVREHSPFHQAWRKDGWTVERYTAVYVAPVNIEHMLQNSAWKNLERGSQVVEDARRLAVYARETCLDAFANDPEHRLAVVEQPGPGVLILELAIVELVPNKILLSAASHVPLYGMAASALNATSKSVIAFEARFRDGDTWEVVSAFADRESSKASLVNFKNYAWYEHHKSILREWARQFVQVVNAAPDASVRDSRKFELKPW